MGWKPPLSKGEALSKTGSVREKEKTVFILKTDKGSQSFTGIAAGGTTECYPGKDTCVDNRKQVKTRSRTFNKLITVLFLYS